MDKQVGGLDVTMYNLLRVVMYCIDGISQIVKIALRQGKGQRLLRLQEGFQGASGDKRHDEIEQGTILAKVQHRHDIFVSKLVSVASFTAKALYSNGQIHIVVDC